MQISLAPPAEVPPRLQIKLPAPEAHVTPSLICLGSVVQPGVSPKKRARNVGSFFERKKGKRRRESPQRTLESLMDTGNKPLVDLGSDFHGTGSEDMNIPPLLSDGPGMFNNVPELYSSNPVANLLASQDNLTSAEEFDLAFAIYLDALAAHAVCIIQICEALFVVQGWNTMFNWGTVRIDKS